jgi:pimeloyl-ACP methyl ester carboxylesterase
MPALAARRRVIALDQRGHGRGIRSRAPFRLTDCADDAAALISRLGLGSCTVVGYSMGGAVAQLVWKRHPSAVSGLVLCATAARFTPSKGWVSTLAPLGRNAGAALSLLPQSLRRSGMAYATARWSTGNSSADWAAEDWGRSDPAALVQAGLSLSGFDSRPWIHRVDVPTAVVVTEHDTTVPTRRQKQLAEQIPGAVAFPVAGNHRICVDNPGLFVPALNQAIDSVQRKGAGV